MCLLATLADFCPFTFKTGGAVLECVVVVNVKYYTSAGEDASLVSLLHHIYWRLIDHSLVNLLINCNQITRAVPTFHFSPAKTRMFQTVVLPLPHRTLAARDRRDPDSTCVLETAWLEPGFPRRTTWISGYRLVLKLLRVVIFLRCK